MPDRKPIATETVEQWYEVNAEFFIHERENVEFTKIHSNLLNYLPQQPCSILEIGAGAGRDAAGFADLGHHVIAVEPSNALRTNAKRMYERDNIDWLDDKLPKLDIVVQLERQFEVIVLSAVWMHLAPKDRKPAFERIIDLLNPDGLLYLTLRHGPFEAVDGFWDIADAEVKSLAQQHELIELLHVTEADQMGRSDITWGKFIYRKPNSKV